MNHLAAIEDESTTVVTVEIRANLKIARRMVVIPSLESTTTSVEHSKRVDVEVKNGTLIATNAESSHARGLESPNGPCHAGCTPADGAKGSTPKAEKEKGRTTVEKDTDKTKVAPSRKKSGSPSAEPESLYTAYRDHHRAYQNHIKHRDCVATLMDIECDKIQ